MERKERIKRIVRFDDFDVFYHEERYRNDIEGHIRIMHGTTKMVEASVPVCADDDEVIDASKQLLALYLSLVG